MWVTDGDAGLSAMPGEAGRGMRQVCEGRPGLCGLLLEGLEDSAKVPSFVHPQMLQS